MDVYDRFRDQILGSYDSHLYGIDAKTGKERWKVQTNGMVHATPAVQNGLAFIAGCDSVLRAIRVTDGKEVSVWAYGSIEPTSACLDAVTSLIGVKVERRETSTLLRFATRPEPA